MARLDQLVLRRFALVVASAIPLASVSAASAGATVNAHPTPTGLVLRLGPTPSLRLLTEPLANRCAKPALKALGQAAHDQVGGGTTHTVVQSGTTKREEGDGPVTSVRISTTERLSALESNMDRLKALLRNVVHSQQTNTSLKYIDTIALVEDVDDYYSVKYITSTSSSNTIGDGWEVN